MDHIFETHSEALCFAWTLIPSICSSFSFSTGVTGSCHHTLLFTELLRTETHILIFRNPFCIAEKTEQSHCPDNPSGQLPATPARWWGWHRRPNSPAGFSQTGNSVCSNYSLLVRFLLYSAANPKSWRESSWTYWHWCQLWPHTHVLRAPYLICT